MINTVSETEKDGERTMQRRKQVMTERLTYMSYFWFSCEQVLDLGQD